MKALTLSIVFILGFLLPIWAQNVVTEPAQEFGLEILSAEVHPYSSEYVVNFTSDGQYIHTTGLKLCYEVPYTEIFWSQTAGKPHRVFYNDEKHLTGSRSPDGKYFLTGINRQDDTTGDIDGYAMIYDIDLGLEIRRFVHGPNLTAVAYSPDGKQVLTWGNETENEENVILWDAQTGEKTKTWRVDSQDVVYAVFSPDGRRLITMRSDAVSHLWELEGMSSIPLDLNPFEYTVYSLNAQSPQAYFSPDNRYVVANYGNWPSIVAIGILDIQTGLEVRYIDLYENKSCSTAMTHDGQWILSGDRDVKIWDVKTGEQIGSLNFEGKVNSIAVSPDDRFALAGSYGDFYSRSVATLWDLKTQKALRTFVHNNENAVYLQVAFSPSGNQIVTLQERKEGAWAMKLWDISDLAATSNVSDFMLYW